MAISLMTVDILGESTPKDKQELIVQSTDCRQED